MRPPRLGRLMALAILVVTVSTQPVFLLGAAFLQIGDELGFGPTGLGVLTALFFLTASVSSAPLGKMVERIGWQRAMRINVVASLTMTLLIAAVARHIIVLGLLLVLAGSVYGLANPSANQALADHVDPRRRALVFGLKHAGIPLSSLVAGLAVPVIVLTVGWRPAFVTALALGGIVLALIPGEHIPAGSHGGAPDPRRAVAPLSPHLLTALALASSFATWAAIALSTYLVAAAVDVGFTEAEGGLLLFAGSGVSITARVSIGALTDRVGGRGFGAMATLTGLGAVVFLLLVTASGPAFAALVVAGFATGWAWPGLMTYTVVNANAGSAASSSAITQAGVFVGAGFGPVILGAIIDRWGFDAAWITVAVALAIATLGVGLVGRTATASSRPHLAPPGSPSPR